MARIGFRKAKYNKIAGDTYAPLKDDKVPMFEKIIDEKFSPEYNNAELYANDALAESDSSFKKGTVSLTVADDDDVFCAELSGNNTSDDGGEVTKNIEDVTPEFGYGHIIKKVVNGVKKYKVEFFPRVKFHKITTDAKTKGESVEFGTTAIEGTVMPLETALNGFKVGDWEKNKTFVAEQEAETYLDGLLTPTA